VVAEEDDDSAAAGRKMWKLIMLETRANRFYANGSQYPDTSLPCVNTTDSPPEPYGLCNDSSTNVPWGTERCIVCSPVRFANLFSHSIHLGFGVTTSLFLPSFVPPFLSASLPAGLHHPNASLLPPQMFYLFVHAGEAVPFRGHFGPERDHKPRGSQSNDCRQNGGTTRDISGEKTVFLSHLYIKTISLPRQARDKHRESTHKERCVLCSALCADPDARKSCVL
jgi:hypothetical protein